MVKPRILMVACGCVALAVAGALAFRFWPRVDVPKPPAPPPAIADCLLPAPAPQMPDATTATAADMKRGHDTIQSFVEALEAYQACRNAQVDHPPPNTSDQQRQTWIDDGNAAIDEANALARAYSAQLKLSHARAP